MASTPLLGLDRKPAGAPRHFAEVLIEVTARRVEDPRAVREAGKEPYQ